MKIQRFFNKFQQISFIVRFDISESRSLNLNSHYFHRYYSRVIFED